MSAGELLDVLDADGRPTGVAKPRGDVHRDGDWHRCVHVWVVGRDSVLLQRRGRHKTAWPGRLDATAAGHVVAGETVEEGLREVEEELGVVYPLEELADLGVHRLDERDGSGHNREFQHVFAVRDDRPLTAWTGWNRAELDGLVAVPADRFAAFTTGGLSELIAEELTADGLRPRAVIRHEELVPAVYLSAVAERLTALAAAPSP